MCLKPGFLVDEFPLTTTAAPFNTAFQVSIVFLIVLLLVD